MSLWRIIGVSCVAAVFCSALLLMAVGGCTDKSASEPDPDRTPPSLVSAAATDEIHVNVAFSERLDEDSAENIVNYTITRSLVTSEGAQALPVVGAVLLEDEKSVLLETDPQSDASYVLEVSDVEDLAGNAMTAQTIDFTGSVQGDTTAPVVTGTSPADGESGVDTLATVTIEFSERMNRVSVESSFQLEEAPGGYSVSGSFAWEANNARAIFTPTEPLEDYTLYSAGIGTGAMDVAGNHLASEYPWSFTTGNAGAIAGTITYTGPEPPSPVVIGVFTVPCFVEPVTDGWTDSPGSYIVQPVPPGTYYVAAVMDVNGNEDPDIGEPAGMYDANHDGAPDPVVVVAGQTRSGINLPLDYEFGLSTISGVISKTPDVTDSDTTYVLVFTEDPTQGEEVELAAMAIVPDGTGPYTSTPLPICTYYIICFMDLNGNGELDFVGDVPSEPVGFHGELQGEEPVLTPLFVIEDVSDIDMTLFYFSGFATPPLALSALRDVSVSRFRAADTFARR